MNRRTFISCAAAVGTSAILRAGSPLDARTTAPGRTQGPRTLVPAGRLPEFREYCTRGDGAPAFSKIRADLDRDWMDWSLPEDPLTYGDPSPERRDSNKVDRWRDVQDTCGRAAGVAEAAMLCWLVTADERYLAKARSILVGTSKWKLAPEWRAGPVPGATDIRYNDEGHFRLWRKLPLVFDQLREALEADERHQILQHFRRRGVASVDWIEKEGSIRSIRRNSIDADLSSHPVRFMPMTGLSALALWDDLPEAKSWWAFADHFYKSQFSPWGGDDGGWAEGVAYWRGTMEHASFQDALLALGDTNAYSNAFWRNTAWFCVYNIQPYLATSFGDLSNAGKFNLEPAVADFLLHLARVHQDGRLRAYAELCSDTRPRPSESGLAGLDRRYPTSTEFLFRNFAASRHPLPEAQPLSTLPPTRWFRDVGWVSMHSALGRPAEDIHVTFVSSPYGSFSHSHAHQNGFILNAFGAGLAVNSGFREWHNSPHHDQWTRQTRSKNALLIDGRGQKPRSKASTGRITRVQSVAGTWLASGDATESYAAEQPGRVRRVTRDLAFVDLRYLVIRDVVETSEPTTVQWLLHTERTLVWDEARNAGSTTNGPAALAVRLVVPPVWTAQVAEGFPVAVDPKYVTPGQINYTSSGEWNLLQNHLTAATQESVIRHVIFAVLWPHRASEEVRELEVALDSAWLRVTRPDSGTDSLRISDEGLEIA